MDTRWFKDIPKDLENEIRQNYKESITMRKRLIKILEDTIAESNASSRLKSGYDNPNWAFLQADQRGYERALAEVIRLMSK